MWILRPTLAARLKAHHQTYLEQGYSATADVLARLAASEKGAKAILAPSALGTL